MASRSSETPALPAMAIATPSATSAWPRRGATTDPTMACRPRPRLPPPRRRTRARGTEWTRPRYRRSLLREPDPGYRATRRGDTKKPAPHAPPSTTSKRRHRCSTRSTTTTTAGTRMLATCASASSKLTHRRRDPCRSAPEVGRRAIAGGRGQRDHHREDGGCGTPHHQAHHVAGMTEVAVARWSRVDDRRARWGRAELSFWRRERGHVVPSRATAATTRSMSTEPASRPK